MFILFSAKFELTASEANVVQSRVVKVADSAFVRLDAGLHSANSVVADFAVVAPVSAGVAESVDFITAGALETDVVCRRVVGLCSGRTDPQLETRHVTAEGASLNPAKISGTA